MPEAFIYYPYMFRTEPTPLNTYQGFHVEVFRQGRSNQAERVLQRPIVVFAPLLHKVGVFLPNGPWSVEEALLAAAWRAQGSPRPHQSSGRECVLFGRSYPVEVVPFTGCDDLWQEQETIYISQLRAPKAKRIDDLILDFRRTQLLEEAERILQRYQPRLLRLPQRIVIAPLRPRILGQCTREGEIRLNLSLLQWPKAILEETLVHELTHLVEFNHSVRFWRHLTSLLPDWLPRSLVHYLAIR